VGFFLLSASEWGMYIRGKYLQGILPKIPLTIVNKYYAKTRVYPPCFTLQR